ncbi:MAG: ABC transporter substrate-binding protein [Oscillospiraceae bacterium]|nr:ABC transporter substrate-binding protein [Oscillospiraceae bacterium]
MKKTGVLSIFLGIALLLSACGQQPAAPTELDVTQPAQTQPTAPNRAETFGLAYDPMAGFNPYRCTTLINRSVMSLLYQGLFSITSSYQAEPVLCKTFSVSQDLKTYTFTLENARFSSGIALTAADVAASLQAARNSAVYGDRLKHVAGISPQEDGTLVLTLDTPYENLPLLLDIPIVPADETEESQPHGTGPYRLIAGGETLRLEQVQNWWSDYPSAIDFDTLYLNAAASPSEVRNEFEFGNTDLVCADPSAKTYVPFRCDYELWDCATGILLYLGCNRGAGPFSNGAVRSALTHGVKRESLIGCYSGFAEAAYLPASPASSFYEETLASQYGYDPGIFSDALANAGLKNTSAILLVDGDDPARVKAAEAIAADLNECGLLVTVDQRTGESYKTALEQGQFDLYLGQIRLSPNFDLSPFFEEGGAANYGSMASGTTYALCLAALENSGNYYELHKAVMDSGQLCPLLLRTYAVYATRGAVSNLLPGLDNVFHTSNSRQLSDAKT